MTGTSENKEPAKTVSRNRLRRIQEPFRRTRKDHSMETAEDYVELIDDLILEQREARIVDIARRLDVSAVTVNQTISRLQRDGLVEKEPYRSVFLTAKGRELAQASRRRHETVYQFLCRLGVSEKQARIDAEGIEHHISEATLRKMLDFLK